jgi:hypothetical protein
MIDLFESYHNVIDLCLLNSALAFGCFLLLGVNLFSLATGGLMALGAYLSIWLTMQQGWAFGPSLLASLLIGSAAAFALGSLVLRLRGDYFTMATLAFTEVVRVIALNWDSATGGALGVFGIPKLTETWHLALLLVVVIYFTWAVRRSRIGERMRAVASDELADHGRLRRRTVQAGHLHGVRCDRRVGRRVGGASQHVRGAGRFRFPAQRRHRDRAGARWCLERAGACAWRHHHHGAAGSAALLGTDARDPGGFRDADRRTIPADRRRLAA